MNSVHRNTSSQQSNVFLDMISDTTMHDVEEVQDDTSADTQRGTLVGGGPIVPGVAFRQARAASSQQAPAVPPPRQERDSSDSPSSSPSPSPRPAVESSSPVEVLDLDETGEVEILQAQPKVIPARATSAKKGGNKGPSRTHVSSSSSSSSNASTTQVHATEVLDQTDMPLVITFDSLRSRQGHHQVNVDLSLWLRHEAKDKMRLEVDQAKECKHLDASVPQQPNWWDCGIYVIHFFEQFASDPRAALQELKRCNPNAAFWRASQVTNQRQRWKQLIQKLSGPWLERRKQAQEEECLRRQEEEANGGAVASDDDYEMVVDLDESQEKSHP